MGGGNSLAHDAPGDGDELEVDVGDAFALNTTRHLFDRLGPPVFIHEALEVCRHGSGSLLGKRCSPIVNNRRGAGKTSRVSILLTLQP